MFCNTSNDTRGAKSTVGSGTIFRCPCCNGLYLFPPVEVNYDDFHWTEKRELGWDSDIKRAAKYAPKILSFIKRKYRLNVRSVLEIGCGTGYMGYAFEELGLRYRGIDIDSESIRYGKKMGMSVHDCDAQSINQSPLKGERFDLIISSNTFEHLDNPLHAFKNLRDFCNGIIVIIVPNGDGLFPRLKSVTWIRYIIKLLTHTPVTTINTIDGLRHTKAFTAATLQFFAHKSGLDISLLRTVSINDSVFGFVQPNSNAFQILLSKIPDVINQNSQLLLIMKHTGR